MFEFIIRFINGHMSKNYENRIKSCPYCNKTIDRDMLLNKSYNL